MLDVYKRQSHYQAVPCGNLFETFQIAGQMEEQIVIFSNGKIGGNSNNDGYIFVYHVLFRKGFIRGKFQSCYLEKINMGELYSGSEFQTATFPLMRCV